MPVHPAFTLPDLELVPCQFCGVVNLYDLCTDCIVYFKGGFNVIIPTPPVNQKPAPKGAQPHKRIIQS